MGKHLKVIYGDAVLWDAPVSSLEWHDSEGGIKIEGRVRAKPAGGGGGGLGGGILDMLSKASKAKTAQVAGEKREGYEAETAEPGSEPVEESVGE